MRRPWAEARAGAAAVGRLALICRHRRRRSRRRKRRRHAHTRRLSRRVASQSASSRGHAPRYSRRSTRRRRARLCSTRCIGRERMHPLFASCMPYSSARWTGSRTCPRCLLGRAAVESTGCSRPCSVKCPRPTGVLSTRTRRRSSRSIVSICMRCWYPTSQPR